MIDQMTELGLMSHLTKILHPFSGLFPGQPGQASTRKAEPFWILTKQEMMGVAVASAGPYENHLHLAADRQPLKFFTGHMPRNCQINHDYY